MRASWTASAAHRNHLSSSETVKISHVRSCRAGFQGGAFDRKPRRICLQAGFFRCSKITPAMFTSHTSTIFRGFTTALKARSAPLAVSSASAFRAASKERLDYSGSSRATRSLAARLVCVGLVTGLEALIRKFLLQHLDQIHRLNAEGFASSHNFPTWALSVSFLTDDAGPCRVGRSV